MFGERTFNAGVVGINYAEYDGEERSAEGLPEYPLLLLHGGSARWQASLPIIPDLSRRAHLYAPDLRGHGKSGRVPGHYTLDGYTGDMAAFLEEVVGERAVLYGHSLGGQIAIMLAARHPYLVRGLIIGDAPFDRDKLRARLQRDREQLRIWRDMAEPGHSPEEVVEALKNMPVAVDGRPDYAPARTLFGENSLWFPYMAENLRLLDPEMLTAVINFDDMHAGYDYEQLFPEISCPVLIIQGNPELGGALSDEEIVMGLELLEDGRVTRPETVGHALDHPDKEPLLHAICSFLDTLRADAIRRIPAANRHER